MMKKIIVVPLLMVMSAYMPSNVFAQTGKKQSADQAAIEKLIVSYQDALNGSDAEKVASLFTKDGVLIASAAPTAEGNEQVKGTYKYVFDNFTYSLKFSVIEIKVSGNQAFARSTSKGSFVIKSGNQTVEDNFRELFVFEKENGVWKIARYMYNQPK